MVVLTVVGLVVGARSGMSDGNGVQVTCNGGDATPGVIFNMKPGGGSQLNFNDISTTGVLQINNKEQNSFQILLWNSRYFERLV